MVLALVGSLALSTAESNATPSVAEIPLQETGVITRVADGDTFEFLQDGTSAPVRVRMLGVNTPEVAGFNNAHFDHDFCGGQQARHNLQQWLPAGTRVELRSQSKDSTNKGRILRYPFAFDPVTGAYDIDVSALVAQSGLAMWFTIDGESDLSYPYRLLVDEAQRQGLGIWSPAFCGPLEQPSTTASLTVIWNPPGPDTLNLNGESVVVRNIGTAPLDLSGWLLRDSSLTSWFYFPTGTVLTAGDYLVAHVGSGTAGVPTAHDYYIGAQQPLFPNTSTTQFLGDGAYLLDRNTAIRAYDIYPCVSNCTDELIGKVVIAKVQRVSTSPIPAVAANQERITVTNLTGQSIPLDGYYLRRKVSSYPFLPGSVLGPRASIRVLIGRGIPTASTQYWGQSRPLLSNHHDTVDLVSNTDVVISRMQW